MSDRPRVKMSFDRAANAVVGAVAAAALLGVVGCAVARGPVEPASVEASSGVAGEIQVTPASGPATTDTTEQVQAERRADVAGEALVGTENFGMPTLARGLTNPHLEFIVRFESGEAARVIESFRQNPNEARGAWASLAARDPAFRGLRLKRAGYRGECTLEWAGPIPPIPAAVDELSREILDRLNNADGVAYAEPNLVGWRGSVEQ